MGAQEPWCKNSSFAGKRELNQNCFALGRLLGYLFLCSNDELAAMCAFRMANWNSLATNGAKELSSRLSTWNGKIDSVPILSSSWLQDRKAERPCRQLPYYVTLCEPSVFGPSLSAWLQLLPFSVVPRPFFLASAAFSCPVSLASSAALALHSALRTSSQHSIQLFQAVSATYLHPKALAFAPELARGPAVPALMAFSHPRAPAFRLPLWFMQMWSR